MKNYSLVVIGAHSGIWYKKEIKKKLINSGFSLTQIDKENILARKNIKK